MAKIKYFHQPSIMQAYSQTWTTTKNHLRDGGSDESRNPPH